MPAQTKHTKRALARGTYKYFHYESDGFKDRGWGCAYRALQTVLSWLWEQGRVRSPVLGLGEIQAMLDRLDGSRRIAGSRQWLGALEVSWVLGHLGVPARLYHLPQAGSAVQAALEVMRYLETRGCPVMFGGDKYAYTVLGVEVDFSAMNARLLILDPHYLGED